LDFLVETHMSDWTDYQLLKDGNGHEVRKETVSHEGPACYVIGLRKGRNGKIRTVYVGDTGNLLQRMRAHANWDATTGDYIKKSLANGFTVWFCYHRTKTPGRAKDMAASQLEEWWSYPWNVIGRPF
jgi:hypothetical protein